MKEIWKEIPGFEDYEVSNFGRVYSKKKNRERILKTTVSYYGYDEPSLCMNAKPKRKKVHRLVAQAFIPNPQNKPCVNHIDGNKLNNHIDNLEWCTYKENMIHARDNDLNGKIYYGEDHHSCKISDDEVLFIRTFGHLFLNRELSREFNLSDRHISGIKRYELR